VSVDLRAERLRLGKSARELAEEIGVSEDVLLYAERNPRRRPTPGNAHKIATFFEIDVLEQWPEHEAAA
jgi:transcriptional regulator with XRE-family HTH domain